MSLQTNNTARQRARVLARLEQGPATTIELRDQCNVMQPAARVKELRDRGHPIRTHRLSVMDAQGRAHAGVALYYFAHTPAPRVAA